MEIKIQLKSKTKLRILHHQIITSDKFLPTFMTFLYYIWIKKKPNEKNKHSFIAGHPLVDEILVWHRKHRSDNHHLVTQYIETLLCVHQNLFIRIYGTSYLTVFRMDSQSNLSNSSSNTTERKKTQKQTCETSDTYFPDRMHQLKTV